MYIICSLFLKGNYLKPFWRKYHFAYRKESDQRVYTYIHTEPHIFDIWVNLL